MSDSRTRQCPAPGHSSVWLSDTNIIYNIERGTDAYRDNYRAFSSAMLKLGIDSSWDVVHTFASELRQGEMDGIRNLAALLMSRLVERQLAVSS